MQTAKAQNGGVVGTATHVGHGFKHRVPQSSLLAFLRLELLVVPVTDIGCFPLVIQYAPNKTMVTYGDRYWIYIHELSVLCSG